MQPPSTVNDGASSLANAIIEKTTPISTSAAVTKVILFRFFIDFDPPYASVYNKNIILKIYAEVKYK